MNASKLLAAAAIAATPALAAVEIVEIRETPVTTYAYNEPVTTYYYYTPHVTEVREEIVVTAPSLTEDEAINRDVVDTLASDPRLSGRIGVETYDRRVELTGVVTTSGQARIAARDALGVAGVREVDSQLRTRIGGTRY